MKIEILVFDGCPNSAPAEKLVRDTVAEFDIDAQIKIIDIIDNDDAIAKRFLGSPSIRIDGEDLEVEENEFTQYSMRCRAYRLGDNRSGLPSRDLLAEALRSASTN